MSLQKVAKGSFFLFVSTIISSALGYAFWFIISSIGGPEIVGLASTAISLATLFLVIAQFGIPTGTQRFLGKSVGQNNMESFKDYVEVELTIIGLTTCVVALFFSLLRHEIKMIMGLPEEYVLVVSMIIIARGLVAILKGVYISLVQTKEVAIAEISGFAIRLILGVALVIFGFGGLGATLSHFIGFTVILAILSILFVKSLGRISFPKLSDLKVKGLEILRAGMANWPSDILITLGPLLGVIFVYGYYGAMDAGLYYIAQAIMMVIVSIPMSVMAIMFPLLSGMGDGRKRAIWRVIRISLIVSTPIVIITIIYSHLILGFFGQEYLKANVILTILCISIIPEIISTGISNLSYAYGMYDKVISIGLAKSAPRVILYLILTPLFGGIGAAEAFLIGSMLALIIACFIAYILKLKINLHDMTLIILVPASIGFVAYFTKLNWAIGAILILIFSFITYAKLRLIIKNDLKEISQALLPQRLVKMGIRRFSWMLKMLYGE